MFFGAWRWRRRNVILFFRFVSCSHWCRKSQVRSFPPLPALRLRVITAPKQMRRNNSFLLMKMEKFEKEQQNNNARQNSTIKMLRSRRWTEVESETESTKLTTTCVVYIRLLGTRLNWLSLASYAATKVKFSLTWALLSSSSSSSTVVRLCLFSFNLASHSSFTITQLFLFYRCSDGRTDSATITRRQTNAVSAPKTWSLSLSQPLAVTSKRTSGNGLKQFLLLRFIHIHGSMCGASLHAHFA